MTQYDNIPAELRQLPQWVCWRYEDRGGVKPTKVPYMPNGSPASHNDRLTWSPYNSCVTAAQNGYFSGIGFVLAADDPYCFIDLDDTYDDREAAERQQRIFQAFNSYSERSPSKRGLHIIIKAALPSGRKRSHVELYSQLRFMTMTGDVFHNTAIENRHDLANELWAQMGPPPNAIHHDGTAPQQFDDVFICQTAAKAANGEKFNQLYFGHWQSIYSSQSEADFALVDIIAFYTQNRDQIVRIFRSSALGQRAKAQREDYVDYMVRKSFDRMLPPVDFDGLRDTLEQVLQKQEQRRNPFPSTPNQNPFNNRGPQEVFESVPLPGHAPNLSNYPTVAVAHIPRLREERLVKVNYDPPPGLMGEIAQFIYAASPQPVPEIALVGAMALMAGVCGRAYNVSGMGLNQYLLLIAQTGVGKESIASGIDKLMGAVRTQVPGAVEFIGPSEIQSPEALLKYLNYGSSSFVSLFGEFGLRLKAMSSMNAPSNLVGLRRLFLDLFNKSGEGKELKPMIYSDKHKNTEIVLAPAFSMMGESTPERFYGALNEDMISEGLLPRFTMVEYHGDVPEFNYNHQNVQPSQELVTKISQLCSYSLQMNKANRAIHVVFDDRATDIFVQFQKYCRSKLNNAGYNDIPRQLWNRAHVKAMKLAAMIAVGAHPFQPVITEAASTWAINLVVSDTQNMLMRFETGAIGMGENSDTKQLEELSKAISEYVMAPFEQVEKYNVELAFHQSRVIPYSYISRRIGASSAFKNDKRGSTNAIKSAIQAMMDRGDIQEIPRNEVGQKFKTSARCFMISNPKAFRFQ